MDNNLLRIHEINPFKLYREELKLLEGLPLRISLQTPDGIRQRVVSQEKGKLWVGMVMVWGIFLGLGALCSGCTEENSTVWILVAVPIALYMFLQKSISDDELNEIIKKKSRILILAEIKKAQTHLLNHPFMIRREDAIIENLPQLTHIETLLDHCKRESTMAAQRLLLYKSQLHDLLPEDAIVDDHLHKPNVRRLALRVNIFQDLMKTFEKTFALFMNERNRLLIEREKIRMQATLDFHNDNIPSPQMQGYPSAPLELIDKEQQLFFEETLEEALKEFQNIDIRWRQAIEGFHEDDDEGSGAASEVGANTPTMAPGLPEHREMGG